MAEYVCKFCGQKTSVPSLQTMSCPKSPHDNHEWTEAKSKYICKYCGESVTVPSLSSGYCSKSPHKNHEWA